MVNREITLPLIGSIYLNILQVLNLKFAKINKRGGPNKVRGWEKFPKINKRPPRLLGTKEY